MKWVKRSRPKTEREISTDLSAGVSCSCKEDRTS